MDTSILKNKITPPQSQLLLHRQRLQKALDDVHTQNLLVISAPTGYGKTSLLVDFARSTHFRLAWYTLEETDRDPTVFCRYLLMAVRRSFPGFGAGFESLLNQNLNELQAEPMLRRMADQFAHELVLLQTQADTTTIQMLLVLDDFQFAESQRVSWFLQRLIGILPSFVHLIIASRTQPKNLMLVRLLAKQKVSFLGPPDLAFTQAEIVELLKQFYNMEQPDKLAATLAGYSEGWITAIVLLLNARGSTRAPWLNQAQTDLNPTELGFEVLFDYLALEVFRNLEPELQDFLVNSAFLTWLTPDKCAALLQEPGKPYSAERCRQWLNHLLSLNLFITSHQSEDGLITYQYHNLFGRFLQSQLKDDPPAYRNIHYRAALVEKAAGNSIEAVRHLGEAGETLEAAALLNEIAQSLYATGRTDLLAELLDRLPQDTQNDFPHLLNVQARLLLEQGDNQAAMQKYTKAVAGYNLARANDWAARATADKAQLMLRMGQFWDAQAEAQKVINNAPQLMLTEQGRQAAASARLVAGMVASEHGRGVDAEKHFREAAEIYRELRDDFRLAVIDTLFGHLYHHQGRMVKSTIYYERSLQQFIKSGNRSREAYSRTNLANNYYIQHRYQPAEEMLQEALTFTSDLKDQYLSLFLHNILANIYRDTMRYAKARPHYEEAIRLARQGQVRKMELINLHDQATSLILQGHYDEAAHQIQFTLELAAEYNLPGQAGYSYRNLAWLEYSHRAYRRSATASEKALTIFETANSPLE
jgi:ATP/maltotriose-dependent transcriptional regulator MalT